MGAVRMRVQTVEKKAISITISIKLLSPVKKLSHLHQERNMHRSSIVYKRKQSKTILKNMLVDFDVRGQQGWTFLMEETLLWIMDSYLIRSNG